MLLKQPPAILQQHTHFLQSVLDCKVCTYFISTHLYICMYICYPDAIFPSGYFSLRSDSRQKCFKLSHFTTHSLSFVTFHMLLSLINPFWWQFLCHLPSLLSSCTLYSQNQCSPSSLHSQTTPLYTHMYFSPYQSTCLSQVTHTNPH